MQGLSSRRKAADMLPFSCILSCGLKFLESRDFRQVNGMTSALVVASKLVCFQFCRFQSMTLADRTSFDFGNLCIYPTAYHQ